MKNYKTKQELLDHLEKERNIVLEKELIPVFDVYRYGQIIDAYKEILASNILSAHKVHIYDASITLGSFVNMMYIDELFSVKLVAYISHYEKILKKYISDKVCESMVANGDNDCCNYTLLKDMKDNPDKSYLSCFISLNKEFDKSGKEVLRNQSTLESRERVIDKILDFASGKNSSELNYYVSDYYQAKHSIPFYILIGSLSFTNLTVLFEMLTADLQNDFIKKVHMKTVINPVDISSASGKHSVIRKIRNIIHHHEPLIPYLCKNEYNGFEIKKDAIRLLKKIYDNCEFSNKLEVKSTIDYETR